MRRVGRRPRFLTIPLAVAIASSSSAAGDAAAGAKTGLCATAAPSHAEAPYVGILSAFPAELVPLAAATSIESIVEIDERTYYLGRLAGIRVVLGLSGIGLVNAERRTAHMLANFDVAALLMSGVAGSRYRIGDVVLASEWTERSGPELYDANPVLLALARRAGKRVRPGALETCTPVPPTAPDAPVVCLPYDPAIILDGHGFSDDILVVPCVGTHWLYGCKLPDTEATSAAAAVADANAARAGATTTSATGAVAAAAIAEDLVDMETAAVARVAAAHGVPFLGVRAVSDGAGDPLGEDGGAQFFNYYRLAAENAAFVTRAVVAEVAKLARKRPARRTCRLLAKGRWRRAAAGIGAPTPAPASGSGY